MWRPDWSPSARAPTGPVRCGHRAAPVGPPTTQYSGAPCRWPLRPLRTARSGVRGADTASGEWAAHPAARRSQVAGSPHVFSFFCDNTAFKGKRNVFYSFFIVFYSFLYFFIFFYTLDFMDRGKTIVWGAPVVKDEVKVKVKVKVKGRGWTSLTYTLTSGFRMRLGLRLKEGGVSPLTYNLA